MKQKAAHTPGPWNCNRSSASGYDIVCSENSPTVMRIFRGKERNAMDSRLPAVAAECGDHLHDCAGREQAPESMGVRTAEPTALAGLDCCECRMGASSNELGPLGGVRQKPSEMEQVIFAEAIWRAFAQCFLTHEEAIQAIEDYGNGLLHNYRSGGQQERQE